MADSKTKTLEELIATGRALLREHDPCNAHRDFEYWDDEVAEWLDRTYPGTGLSGNWSGQPGSMLVSGNTYSNDSVSWAFYKGSVQRRLSWLSEFGVAMSKSKTTAAPTKSSKDVAQSSKIFVVHGRNEAVREAVARFLEKLGLEPIILHEQPNKGRTIIEKFIDHSQVGFAVVLLTADDIGGMEGTDPSELKPRSRQNVIFELGFFVAKLGRDRVCALHQSGIELPSDYHGMLYVQIDESGAWRLQLARELKAVGLPVDFNHAI